MAVSPRGPEPPPVCVSGAPSEAREKGIVMELHPLHALYLGRNHGEVGTLALRGRPTTEEGPVAGDRGAGILAAGLGLVAAVVAAELAAKLTGGK